jgi:hypothetical protein
LNLHGNCRRVTQMSVKIHYGFVLKKSVTNKTNDHLLVKGKHSVHVMYVHLYFVHMTKMGERVMILRELHLSVKRVHVTQKLMGHDAKNRRSD